jgi:exonuclease 3'-5' domain-containing protein 2
MCHSCAGVCLALPDYVAVFHVQTSEEFSKFANQLFATHVVIALDVEWRPGATEPALLQIATEESVALVDLLALRRCSASPAILRDLLMHEQVVRLGWRFETDLRMLASWMPCLSSVDSYIEVADLVLPIAEPTAMGDGLANFVHRSIGMRLCKRFQCSDWESRPLSADQVRYAALDAYALLLLTERASRLPDHSVLKLGDQRKYRPKSSAELRVSRAERMQGELSAPNGNLRGNPEKRMAFITRFCVRAQVYSNCRLLSSSGVLVAHCDRAKAEWYLAKNIARRLGDDEPLTVQLRFCPEERGAEYDELASKNPRVNRCVVCGAELNLSRFHLIPKAYQRYFDVRLKAHQCHDIVLLCVDCHEISNRQVMALKIAVSREFNAPLKGTGRTVPSAEERNVVKAASALLRGVGL